MTSIARNQAKQQTNRVRSCVRAANGMQAIVGDLRSHADTGKLIAAAFCIVLIVFVPIAVALCIILIVSVLRG